MDLLRAPVNVICYSRLSRDATLFQPSLRRHLLTASKLKKTFAHAQALPKEVHPGELLHETQDAVKKSSWET